MKHGVQFIVLPKAFSYVQPDQITYADLLTAWSNARKGMYGFRALEEDAVDVTLRHLTLCLYGTCSTEM